MKPAKDKLDPDKTNASYLLGVNGLVTIGHGSSTAEGVKNAIIYTNTSAEKGFINKFTNTISEL
jgi:fatty acid/phospholipid biosynthesis enzyme